ncbi:MAG TPA: hypothetical protein VGN83_00460 [Falsiroseomonas sp.]|jgi:hypothetical protein|nr:hypothetical protein [Falsiroseomonas sp.]
MSLISDLLSSLLDLFVWVGGLILKPFGLQRAFGAAYPVVAVLFGMTLMGVMLLAVLYVALERA